LSTPTSTTVRGNRLTSALEDPVSAFANWPISRKLLVAFAAVVTAIFASSAILYDRLRVIEEIRNSRIHTTNVLETLGNVLDAMVNQETGVRGYLIGGDEKFLEPYHKGAASFGVSMDKLAGLTARDASQQQRLDELRALAEKWRAEVAEREIGLMARPDSRQEARAFESSRVGKAVMDQIRAKVDEIDRVERSLLAKRDALQQKAFVTAYSVTILGGTVSLVIAVLMAVLLARSITRPITRMTTTMAALAHGDTSVEVPAVDRTDEIGAMAGALKVFKDSIIERERTQAELTHANRVMTMGQFTASIAHEVNQPIAGVAANAEAALRWLHARPPELAEVQSALERIVADAGRAGDVISRIRALVRKTPQQTAPFDLNDAIRDVIALARSEVLRHGVLLDTRFTRDLPEIVGDRVQLQQVILNLIVNAVEAMTAVDNGRRELLITTEPRGAGGALVAVRDSGPGLDPQKLDRLFEAFYTTKPQGMGMGLAICRSIVEAHGGQISVARNEPQGAVFQFTLNAEDGDQIRKA
jgi:signal transduction histidine kinase